MTFSIYPVYGLTKNLIPWARPDPSINTLLWTCLIIGHVRYINILTWLRGFQVKLLYLVLCLLYLSLLRELRDKRNLKNLQFWPENLGAVLEYWYIERGLFENNHFLKVFGITFRNHHFDRSCGYRMDMKFCTIFLQIGNLQCPSVPKSLISFLEKNSNRNINEVNILSK